MSPNQVSLENKTKLISFDLIFSSVATELRENL